MSNERLSELESEARTTALNSLEKKLAAAKQKARGVKVDQASVSDRVDSLIENAKDALDAKDLTLLGELVPIIERRVIKSESITAKQAIPVMSSKDTTSESKGSCKTVSSSCSSELQSESENVSNMTEKLKNAAQEGNVSEFKRVLAKIDSASATTLPKDIGWGRGTREQADVEMCVEEKFKAAFEESVKRASINDASTEDEISAAIRSVKAVVLNRQEVNETCSDTKPPADADFFYSLYGGLEGITIKDIQEEANLRVGVNAYNQLLRFQPARSDADGDGWINALTRCESTLDCGFGFGLHGWVNLLWTNTGEGSSLTDEDMAAGDEEMMGAADMMNPEGVDDSDNMMNVEAEVEQTIEAELGGFAPVYRKRIDRFGSLLVGPMAQASVKRVENADRFVRRYYGGMRFAYSPETWLDLTYGKTEGLDGRRAEIRGQGPLRNISADSRLFLGFIVNLGVKDSGDAPDSFRVYLTWNTGTSNIFSSN